MGDVRGSATVAGRVLVLRVSGGLLCALDLEAVAEIVPLAELARAPAQPVLLEGFLNLRGRAVPVVRLDRLFGLEPSPPGLYTPLIVLRGQPIAFLADAALEVASVKDWEPVEASGSLNGCAAARFEWGERPVYLLSSERLLLEEERRRVADLQAEMQRRLSALEAG